MPIGETIKYNGRDYLVYENRLGERYIRVPIKVCLTERIYLKDI